MKQVSLGRTLNLFFLASLILPLVIISSFAMYYSTSFLSELSKSNNLQIAESLKASVERFFAEPESNLRILRDLMLFDDHVSMDAEHLHETLKLYHDNQDKFSYYHIIDSEGISILNYPQMSGDVGFDFSSADFFSPIKDGEDKYWSQTYVDRRSGQISIDFALPMNGKILVGTIQLERLENVLSSILEDEGIIVGITDETGVYILHSNYDNVEQRITDPYVNRRMLNYDEVTLDNDQYFGTNMESNYKGWNIVLYEHVSKQRVKVVQFMIVLSVIIVFSTLTVIAIGNRLNNVISLNLARFVDRTRSIAEGDYNEIVESSRFLEFNEIGNNFTQMAEKIQKRETKIIAQNKEIESMNKDLEIRVKERTLELSQANEKLAHTLINLNETREQLIESEKLASLSNLVAGLAHEINTPLGIILTVVTYMQDSTKKITDKLEGNSLTRDELIKYTESMLESEVLIFDNVTRTTDLIGSFKLISSDQTSHESRVIDLTDYIDNIVRGLEPNLKKSNISINLVAPKPIEINTVPGSIYQVMVNLIMNAALHGYHSNAGQIDVSIREQSDSVDILVQDHGAGISEENLKHIFEPFFTTTRGAGGTGLGLNIAYNAIKQNLKGSITVDSVIGKGTKFIVTLPQKVDM